MASFSEFLGSLDADAGKRGKQFEYFVKWFLKNEPLWSTQVDKVWLWEEWPQRWGPDCGIDLIFKHKDGQTWAVQSKCYDPKYNITKHDVDKFLSESNRADIDKRLLIATTDGLGANAKQVCDAQDKEVVRYLLSHFEDADIEYPSSLSDLNNAKPKPKPTPKPHQVDAIGAVKKGFAGTDRGQLIMACGTGKTFTTLWIKEALNSESTLILLPSLGLLSQTLHEWTAAKNQDFAVLCVCSDESVGKNSGDEAVHDIADLAFPVSSDSVEIRKFLEIQGPKVVFSTYQSSNLIADAQTDQKVPAFNLAIADEAHRCAGDKAGNFATILNGKLIRANKRLFATATPRTYSTALKKGAEGRGIEIVGMDNQEVFGQQLYTLNFGEAIKRGLLTDYRVVIVGVDSPMIASYIENREFVKTESGIENDAETLAAQVALLKAMKDFDLHRMISFHSRVSRAEGFAKDLIDVAQWLDAKHRPSGELKTDFVTGDMPTSSRRQKLAILKSSKDNEFALLTNARCLSEGVDVPSLDGVAFIDPRASQVDIIQAVGRAIRLSPNKKVGMIVLPVFISHGDKPEQALDEGNFKPIWDVLNALKSHDDVLADELDQMRVGMGRRSSSKVQGGFSKIEIDLPASVNKSFSDAIQTRLVESTTASWDFMFGLLEKFVDEKGHCLVKRRYETVEGYNLGEWVMTQRVGKDRLTEKRRSKLVALNGWIWDVYEDRWNDAFEALLSYVNQTGNVRPPKKYKTKDGLVLSTWIIYQRKARDTLTSKQIEKLESLSGWLWDVNEEEWNRGFRELCIYYETNNNLLPVNYVTDGGFKLGAWAKYQRTSEATITQERRDKLSALKFWSWDVLSDRWNAGFKELQKYAEINKNTRVPITFVTSTGYELGKWVKTQRKLRGIHNPKRIEQLESVSNWVWDSRSGLWDESFDELLSYVKKSGSANGPRILILENGFNLGNWISDQRANKENLTEDQIKKLESVNGWTWNVIEQKWNEMYERLKLYITTHSSFDLTTVKKVDEELASWIRYQRARKDNLSNEVKKKLESISQWSWDPRNDQWEETFALVKAYAEKNNELPTMKSGEGSYRLVNWINYYRQRKSLLSEEKKKKLETLAGWKW